ncbi:MAG: glycosyltransferase family 1 protein [Sphingobacteriales bacterium]|nr:MAG: glycosyltransferase family 1 protein [Sphingobacteriales bacterium]
MKIGYEAKRIFKNFTGLGNYSRWLVQSLAAAYPNISFYLYTPKTSENPRLNFLLHFKNIIVRTPNTKRINFFWRSFGVVNDAKKDSIDIFHGLSHQIPFGLKREKIKSVVTIHDLIFLRFPQYFKLIDRIIYKFKFKYACKNADTIIAISEQTKNDIVHYFGVNEEKIEVVYQGCDALFYQTITPQKISQVKQKYQLPTVFLLCVGTIENRKNQLLILKSLQFLPSNVQVVLVGKQTKYAQILNQYILQNQLQNRVLFLQNVDFSDLPSIYQLAKIFVYPSVFEGFGIPILEALNCGVPVIAATGSCLEEAGGLNSIYINPNNEHELAKQINLVLNDETLSQNMINQGKQHALNFRENSIAQKLMEVYQKTLIKC